MLLFRSYHGVTRKGSAGKARAIPADQKSGAQDGPMPLRLLSKMPTWKIHQYRALGKQGVQVQKVGGVKQDPNDDDFDSLVRNVGMEGMEEDHDLEPAEGEGPHRGIAMQVFNKNEPSKNSDTVYEPFRAV